MGLNLSRDKLSCLKSDITFISHPTATTDPNFQTQNHVYFYLPEDSYAYAHLQR